MNLEFKMKNIILKLFLLNSLIINAQQLSTSGQSNLKFYQKAIERLKKMSPGSVGYDEAIMDAEKKIASIRKTDPNYDVTVMETEIQQYKSVNNANNEKKEEDWKATKLSGKELDEFLYWSPKSYKNSKTDEDFVAFNKKVDEQIALLSDFCKTKFNVNDRISISKIENHWKVGGSDETAIMETKKFYEKSEELTLYSYYEIKWIYNKWKLFSEAFPQNKVFASAMQKADEARKIIGSADDAKKHGDNVKMKRVAETKMEAASVNDPELESQIKNALSKSKYADGKSIVKINVHSSSWSVQKNSVTGVTLSRTKGFSAGLKDNGGKCWLLHYVDYKQDYSGGKFGQGYINLGEVVEILCENIR